VSADLIRPFLDHFEQITRQEAAAVALLDENGRVLTYRQLDRESDRMLAFLHEAGLGKGETVVSLMPNSLEAFLLFLACLTGGLRYAPLPCTATPAEVETVSVMTNAAIVLVAEPVSPLLDRAIEPKVRRLRRIAIGGSLDWLPERLKGERNGAGQLVITTSGSVGAAKSIVIDGDRLWSAGAAFVRHYGIHGRAPRFWNYLPMSYLGGLFNLGLIPLAAGGSAVVSDTFSGKTFLSFWQMVARYEIDALWMVPAIMRGLAALAERTNKPQRKHGVSTCLLGTAPISLVEKERFRQLFELEVLENYGLSETTFITAETGADLTHRTDGSVGAVLPYVALRLVPPAGLDNGGNQVGATEIAVDSPFLMLGYLRSDGSIDPARDPDGFFRTGDLGKITRDQLVLTGRTRDIIKKGGYLVLLDEIEKLAESHAEVLEAAAVPCPHSFYGESFNLFLLLRTGHSSNDQFVPRFASWLQERLVRHKWPDQIIVRDDFPRTSSGKILKRDLQATEPAKAHA
jgi:acyl-CoA synthetase (AMP-forming)/AMP-acid ligase II